LVSVFVMFISDDVEGMWAAGRFLRAFECRRSGEATAA
jgi:hypothetical protein